MSRMSCSLHRAFAARDVFVEYASFCRALSADVLRLLAQPPDLQFALSASASPFPAFFAVSGQPASGASKKSAQKNAPVDWETVRRTSPVEWVNKAPRIIDSGDVPSLKRNGHCHFKRARTRGYQQRSSILSD